jgi:hypothetical protein
MRKKPDRKEKKYARKITFGGDGAVDGVSRDEDALAGTLAVGLENVDGLHGVLEPALTVVHPDRLHSLHGHLREVLGIAKGQQKRRDTFTPWTMGKRQS